MDSLRALKALGEDLLVFGSAVGTCLQPRSPKLLFSSFPDHTFKIRIWYPLVPG